MRQVPGAKLWIGSADDAGNLSALQTAGIVTVVDLAKDPPPSPAGEQTRLYFPLVDGAGNPPELLRKAIDAVAALIRDDVPTLVSSSWGMSRSAAIAAAAIAQVQDKDASETLVQVCSACNVDVSAPLWLDIYSITHGEGSFVLKVPPTAVRQAPKKPKPPQSRWPL